jgi:hypothetical protein
MPDPTINAPCGCGVRADCIKRGYNGVRFLWPTAFVDCRCERHNKTWLERYEFDFSVPINGKPWEDQEHV